VTTVTTKTGETLEYDDGPLMIGASLLVGHIRRAYDNALSNERERRTERWTPRDMRKPPSPRRIARAVAAAVEAAAEVCTGLTDDQVILIARHEATLCGWSHLGISYVEGTDSSVYVPEIHDGGPVKVKP
jgi:hypothetical protein